MRTLTIILTFITCSPFVYAQKQDKNLERGFSIEITDECSIVGKDDKHLKINIPSVNGTLRIYWPENREALEIQDEDFRHSLEILKIANDAFKEYQEYNSSRKMENAQSERTIGEKVVIVREVPGEKKTFFLLFSGQKNEHLDEVRTMIDSFKVSALAKK